MSVLPVSVAPVGPWPRLDCPSRPRVAGTEAPPFMETVTSPSKMSVSVNAATLPALPPGPCGVPAPAPPFVTMPAPSATARPASVTSAPAPPEAPWPVPSAPVVRTTPTTRSVPSPPERLTGPP